MLIMRRTKAFTLVELLIVIAILAILAAAVIIIINPTEMTRSAKDAERLSSLKSINDSLSLALLEVPASSFGAYNTISVSVPDTSATCANLVLPALQTGWSYRCVTEANLRNTNGTGWIPADLSVIKGGAPISSLPVDPVNAVGSDNYYIYVNSPTGWELDTRLESVKMGFSATAPSKPSLDGGNNDFIYEVGTNLAAFLDNENYLRDGDMEDSGMAYWSNYNTVTLKEKYTGDSSSGLRSMHLITPGTSSYEGTMQNYSVSAPESKKIFVQMNVKMAPGKAMNFHCICGTVGCCGYNIFGGESNTDWKRYTKIVDVSASTNLFNAYYSDTTSEFWLDDLIVRPVY
mgnify:CR=1 FL=1